LAFFNAACFCQFNEISIAKSQSRSISLRHWWLRRVGDDPVHCFACVLGGSVLVLRVKYEGKRLALGPKDERRSITHLRFLNNSMKSTTDAPRRISRERHSS
jgi:hypothetical protein